MKKLSKLSLHEMTNGMRVMTPEQKMHIQGGGDGDTSWWSDNARLDQYAMKGPDNDIVYTSDVYGYGMMGYKPLGNNEIQNMGSMVSEFYTYYNSDLNKIMMFSTPLMYNGYDDGSGNGYGAFDLVANPNQPIDPDTFTKMMSGTYTPPTGSDSTSPSTGSDSGTPCIPNLEKIMQPIVFHRY